MNCTLFCLFPRFLFGLRCKKGDGNGTEINEKSLKEREVHEGT